jgi:hypothetical protein
MPREKTPSSPSTIHQKQSQRIVRLRKHTSTRPHHLPRLHEQPLAIPTRNEEEMTLSEDRIDISEIEEMTHEVERRLRTFDALKPKYRTAFGKRDIARLKYLIHHALEVFSRIDYRTCTDRQEKQCLTFCVALTKLKRKIAKFETEEKERWSKNKNQPTTPNAKTSKSPPKNHQHK